jgi:hypothetical protein
MRVYALNHQRSAALQQYQVCARMLQEEFGAAPEEQTQQLYEALLEEKLTPISPHLTSPSRRGAGDEVPNNLPAQITTFIGREIEVAAVKNLLLQPDVRLVTLTGAGGSGKTRLGLQAATDVLEMFPDGVWFVSLTPIGQPDLVATTIVQALEIPVAGNTPPLQVLHAYLQSRHMLLLLDNFEQIVEAAPIIIDILTAAPDIKILVTSRTVLRVSGEHQDPGHQPNRTPRVR